MHWFAVPTNIQVNKMQYIPVVKTKQTYNVYMGGTLLAVLPAASLTAAVAQVANNFGTTYIRPGYNWPSALLQNCTRIHVVVLASASVLRQWQARRYSTSCNGWENFMVIGMRHKRYGSAKSVIIASDFVNKLVTNIGAQNGFVPYIA
jgi:hypothetical protein